jgi:alkylation response protein AidB-like acyl-CoA dehydrogenase
MSNVTSDVSPALTSVLQNVRELGPTLRERALDAEHAGRLSQETIADLDAAGAFNIANPAEYGGFELSVAQQLEVVSEVSKWDGSCGWVVWVDASTNWIPAGMGSRLHVAVRSVWMADG